MLESAGVPRESFEVLGRRFEELVPLTTEGAFRLLAARQPGGGEPCVVVVAAGGCDASGWHTQQLDEVARAHAQIDCQYVPPVAARGAMDGLEYLALACNASATLESLIHWSALTRRPRIAAGAAIGLAQLIGETLRVAHRAVDPRTKAPLCIGSFGAGNVLFSPDGRPWIVGFGHNVAASLGPRAIKAGSHQAPEVGMGTLPTPASDVYALGLFFRSLFPFVDLLPMAREAISGQSANFAEVARGWADLERRLTASQPAERFQSIEEVMHVGRIHWASFGVVPNVDACVRHFAEMQRLRTDTTTLVIARDASWFRPPGAAHVDMSARKALRRVLQDLAGARLRGPGRARAIADLLVAGWPGEKLLNQSGSNRVYVAIATLRQLGLGDLLRKHATGYLLDPGVPLVLA
jgi:hypothetical protein